MSFKEWITQEYGADVFDADGDPVTRDWSTQQMEEAYTAGAKQRPQVHVRDPIEERRLYNSAFEEEHKFTVWPTDGHRVGAFNNYVAGWHAALKAAFKDNAS